MLCSLGVLIPLELLGTAVGSPGSGPRQVTVAFQASVSMSAGRDGIPLGVGFGTLTSRHTVGSYQRTLAWPRAGMEVAQGSMFHASRQHPLYSCSAFVKKKCHPQCQPYRASHWQPVINHNNNHNEDDLGLSQWAHHHGNGTPWGVCAGPGSWFPTPSPVPTPAPG